MWVEPVYSKILHRFSKKDNVSGQNQVKSSVVRGIRAKVTVERTVDGLYFFYSQEFCSS